jgi:hypothetical protein
VCYFYQIGCSGIWHHHLSFPLKLLSKFTSDLVCSILVTVTLLFAHIISIGPFKGGQQALSEEKKIKKQSVLENCITTGAS